MLFMTLLMPREFATKLLFEAQKSPDQEVCGLVSRDKHNGFVHYPISNIANDSAHSFAMDEQEQIQTMKQIREREETLIAIYHSHPATPPEPSARDLNELGYPQAIYLIISLNIKGVLEMRGWRQGERGVEEVDLKVMA